MTSPGPLIEAGVRDVIQILRLGESDEHQEDDGRSANVLQRLV